MPFKDIGKKVAKLLMGAEDRRRIWMKMAKLLDNGVPIMQALTALRDRKAVLSGKSDFSVVAMDDWIAKMNNGDRFSDAVSEWVPHQEYLLLMAGERSGDLSSSLISSSAMMTTVKNIKSAVISGLMYPIIMGMMGLGVSYMFGVKIFPQFFKIAPEDKWTGAAVYAIKFSHFIQDYVFVLIAVVIVMAIAFAFSLSRWDGKVRVALDKRMPYSIYRTVVGSTWLVSLAAMISAGERIEDALVNMQKGSGKWLSNRIEACLKEMRLGHNMGDALARTGLGFPDQEIIDDLGVYSSVSGFDEALATLGNEWSTESVVQIQNNAKVVFGLGILSVTLLLAFLMGGLISMELQLGDVIKKR